MNHGRAIAIVPYATAHFVVDTCSAATAYAVLSTGAVTLEQFAALLLLYHALAFGLQSLMGLAVDWRGWQREFAVLGCLLAASALALTALPTAAIIITGLGNAMFHVGGGAVSLRLAPHRATLPGLFVAPGGPGLLLGVLLGNHGPMVGTVLVPLALAMCLWMAVVRLPCQQPMPDCPPPRRADWILCCMLFSIMIRALLGYVVAFSWKTQPAALLALVAAATLGKAIGGAIADRWGWAVVGVGATAAALPMLSAAPLWPLAAIPGLCLLNMAMPITLTAAAETLPGRQGFAFGLTCMALLLGALPPMLGHRPGNPALIAVTAAASAAALWFGLRSCRMGPATAQSHQ
jgi:FSR family fosmidomycin resistance protein-like MFS transporter